MVIAALPTGQGLPPSIFASIHGKSAEGHKERGGWRDKGRSRIVRSSIVAGPQNDKIITVNWNFQMIETQDNPIVPRGLRVPPTSRPNYCVPLLRINEITTRNLVYGRSNSYPRPWNVLSFLPTIFLFFFSFVFFSFFFFYFSLQASLFDSFLSRFHLSFQIVIAETATVDIVFAKKWLMLLLIKLSFQW